MNVFLSYNNADAAFAVKLLDDLQRIGHDVWFDQADIVAGEQILSRISQGLEQANALLVVVSKASVGAPFVSIEWLSTMWQELQGNDVTVIPLLLDDAEVPLLLRGRRYADFRKHYIVGWTHLVTALAQRGDSSGLLKYWSDVVDMGEDWAELFRYSTRLDLVMMYGATWRNTFRKHLATLAHGSGQLRVILPDPAEDSPVVPIYARRLGRNPVAFSDLVRNAVVDFSSLGPNVEIHLARVVFTHAVYLFDAGAVLALYAMCCERIPTPAIVFQPGTFTQFARDDVDRIISGHCRPPDSDDFLH